MRVRRAGRALTGSARRGRRARLFVTEILQRVVEVIGSETTGVAPSFKKAVPGEEIDALAVGPGCPWVLSQVGWIGLDGLSQVQLFNQGAPIPGAGQLSWWVSPDKYIYQFKGVSGGGVLMRRCPWVGSPKNLTLMMAKLKGLSSAQLAGLGLV